MPHFQPGNNRKARMHPCMKNKGLATQPTAMHSFSKLCFFKDFFHLPFNKYI